MNIRTGLGRSCHRFLQPGSTKPCVIAGIIFEDTPGFQSKSDGDVVFHALCNAITTLTGVQVLGGIAADLCLRDGITDSEIYLREAIKILGNEKISHVAISLEAKRPRFSDFMPAMQAKIAEVFGILPSQVGITAISGGGLSDVSCGDGVSCMALITTHPL